MGTDFGRTSRRAFIVALSALAATVVATNAHAESTITWLHVETNPDRIAAFHSIADAYTAAHPGVKIEIRFLENEAFKAKLPTLLQSDPAPSIFYTWGGGVLKAQTATGALRDITASLDADGGAWRSSLSPLAVAGMSFGGKIWAAPYQWSQASFFYNKALFKQAGVDATKIHTWGNFLTAVKTIKAAGIVPIAAGGGEKWPFMFYWGYLAMREAGKEGYEAAKAGAGFQSEAFQRASQDLIDLGALEPFQEGYLAADWPTSQAAFADGRAAILLGFNNTARPSNQAESASDGKGLAQDQIGRFVFPQVDGGKGLSTDEMGGLGGWVVTSKAPPETEDFLKFLTNLDNSRLLAAKSGILPVTIGANTGVVDPSMAAIVSEMADATWHQNYLDQDLGPNVGRVVNDVSVELVSGQMKPDEALQQIQDAFSLEK